MSQRVVQIKEQGIEESSKKIMQMIALNWHQKVLSFKLITDGSRFVAWIPYSDKSDEFWSELKFSKGPDRELKKKAGIWLMF